MPIYIPDLSLVPIVTKCLETLKETTPAPYELILVDDGSPIELPELTSAHILIKKQTNSGFSNTVNLGLSVASGEVVVIANDDLEFIDGWLEAMLSHFAKGADLVGLRPEDEPPGSPRFGSIWAITRPALEQVGKLDERMSHYFSDRDYENRVKEAGLTIAKCQAITLPHVGKATYSVADPEDSLYLKDMEAYKEKYGRVD